MKAKTCCQYEPDIELNYDLDECSISCPRCDRKVVKRKIEECVRAWNAEKDGKASTIHP